MQKMFKITLLLLIFLATCHGIHPLSPCASLTDYIIGPRDIIRIEVWNNPDLSREETVTLKGNIFFPLIGEITVKGFTCEQIRQAIHNNLADKYIVNPQIDVKIIEYNSAKIYVLGEVNRPGNYPFCKAMTMVELISMAGGLTQDAGQEAYILRGFEENTKGKGQEAGILLPPVKEVNLSPLNPILEEGKYSQIITIDLHDFNQGVNLHYKLENNDTVYIPKARFFYVIGEVKSPGRYKLDNGINIIQGISIAGGFTQKAYGKGTKIIRTVEDKEHKISVEMNDLIQANDIIKVPASFF
ncbi:MAG: SLBB domain-containing protein [bacterium]